MAKEKADEIEITEKKLVGNIDQNIADLETVIEGITYPLTISINGEWGAGKTVFLKEWAKKKPENSIYIDAFATDFIGDPLAAILSEFSKKEYSPYFDGLFDKLRKTKIDKESFTKNGFNAAAKKLTFNIIDIAKATETKKGSESDKVITFEKTTSLVTDFKDKISENIQGKEKLYVFIDELDRCRPTYAVEFIEIVKHFFEINNTVFVFAINRKELVASIKHVQGCADEDRYLKKFFNLNFDLPPLPTIEFIELLINDDEKTLGLNKEYFDEEFVHTFTLYSDGFDLQPRDQEQVFNKIALALKKHKNNHHMMLFIHPLILMAILRDYEKTRDYYDELFDGSGKPHTIIEKMDIGKKYLKGISDIDKFILEKWLHILRMKINEVSNSIGKDLNSMDNERYGNYDEIVRITSSSKSERLFNKKYDILEILKANSSNRFYIPLSSNRLIEYIHELLNFSNQFTKQDPETSSG